MNNKAINRMKFKVNGEQKSITKKREEQDQYWICFDCNSRLEVDYKFNLPDHCPLLEQNKRLRQKIWYCNLIASLNQIHVDDIDRILFSFSVMVLGTSYNTKSVSDITLPFDH